MTNVGRSNFRQLMLLPLTLLVVLVLVPGSVLAQSTPESTPGTKSAPEFILEPVGQSGPFFTVTAEPDTTTELTVALGNAGAAPVSARTFAADVYTLVNGGFGIGKDGDPVTGPTTWLDYPADSLDLVPNQRIERSFTVSIPADVAPGQYVTGIVLQTADPISVGDSSMLRQTIAKAIAVLITVPGAITPGFTIGAATLTYPTADTSTANLQIEISNDGNVLVKPEGTVTIATADGEPIVNAPVAMGSVYAGMSTTLEIPIPTVLAPGNYLVGVSLTDAETMATAEATDLPLEVVTQDIASPEPTPVSIGEVAIDPVLDSATNKLQVVNISVALVNNGAPVPSARLTLRVMRDGELVEDFPLNSSLVIPTGTTDIQQRYLPITGWVTGTYTFSVILEAVDANSGQTTVLASVDVETAVTAR